MATAARIISSKGSIIFNFSLRSIFVDKQSCVDGDVRTNYHVSESKSFFDEYLWQRLVDEMLKEKKLFQSEIPRFGSFRPLLPIVIGVRTTLDLV